MNSFTIVTTLWGVIGVAFIAVMVYRANLSNHETDQLFLNDEDSVSSTHRENDDVVRRLDTLLPICKGLGGVTILLTLVVVGMYLARTLSGT